MKYFYGRPVSSHALSGSFSCLVGSFVRREKELKRKKTKMKHTRNTCTVQNAHTTKQQNNPENQMRAIGEGLLHFSMLPLMGKFPALPLRQTQWRSFSLWVPTPSLTVPDNFMVQPVSSPGGRAMLPSPSPGTKLGLPLHCALGETFSSN